MSWQYLNLASSDYTVEPDPPHSDLSGLLYAGKRHLVSAPTESLKTLVILAVVIDALRAGVTVVLLDFEMGPSQTRRMLDDLGATAADLANLTYVAPDGPPTADDIEQLDKLAHLVIIDASLGAFHASGLDDNARKDVEAFASTWVQPLWERGITTVVLDHVTKSSEGRGKYTIGSERKVGQVDVHLGLEVIGKPLSRGTSGLVKVRVHKDRQGFLPRPYAAEIHLVSDPYTHAITWEIRHDPTPATDEGSDWRPTHLMQKVRDYLAEHPEPVSRNRVCIGVGGNKTYVLQAIDALIDDNEILEDDGPRNAKLLTLAPVPEQFPEHGTSTCSPVPTPTRGNRTEQVEMETT